MNQKLTALQEVATSLESKRRIATSRNITTSTVTSRTRDVAKSPRSRQTTVASPGYRTGNKGHNPETAMGTVMIKCPDTGRDIPTGMVADRERFRAMPVFFARVLCPLCGKQHEWFAQQAWVCDGEPRIRSPQTILS
jgi:hypothetical protein